MREDFVYDWKERKLGKENSEELETRTGKGKRTPHKGGERTPQREGRLSD